MGLSIRLASHHLFLQRSCSTGIHRNPGFFKIRLISSGYRLPTGLRHYIRSTHPLYNIISRLMTDAIRYVKYREGLVYTWKEKAPELRIWF
jgi:hypothetical protein